MTCFSSRVTFIDVFMNRTVKPTRLLISDDSSDFTEIDLT